MSEPYLIHIANLENGVILKINTALSSTFLDVNEMDLRFGNDVKITGEAYLTDDDLVLHLSASTIAQMPCSVCNQMVSFPLAIKRYYHAEPLNAIKGTSFDFREILRESLLIELPKIIECNQNCPERANLTPFLRKKEVAPDQYFPFNDLKLP